MIIGKSLTALGGGGLKPKICVTAQAGAALNLHYKDSSIILQSYQLGAEETQHTFTVNVSETAYVVEDVTNGASVEVLVDTVAQYSVEIEYGLWLYRNGDECEEITGGWSNYSDTSKYSLSTLVKNNDNLYSQNNTTYGLAGTGNLIDLTNYSTLYAEIKTGTGGNSYGWVGSSVVTAKEWYQETDNPPAFALFQQGSIACDTTKYSLDVSALSGSYYVTIVDYVKSFNIYKVWLE